MKLTIIFLLFNLSLFGQCDSLQTIIENERVILEIQEKEMTSYEWKLDAANKKIAELQKEILFYQNYLSSKKKRKC